jgi:hypothetical protein
VVTLNGPWVAWTGRLAGSGGNVFTVAGAVHSLVGGAQSNVGWLTVGAAKVGAAVEVATGDVSTGVELSPVDLLDPQPQQAKQVIARTTPMLARMRTVLGTVDGAMGERGTQGG